MKTDRINFTGLGAMPLKAVIIRDIGAGVPFAKFINEMTGIGKTHGFDVYVQNAEKTVKGSKYSYNPSKVFPNEYFFPWSQDNMTFTPNGKMLANYFLRSINKVIEECVKRPVQDLRYHIQGGNFFIIKEGKKNSVIIGKEEMNYYRPESIKKDFGVENIYPISQPDFHIDMAIRPLKGKTVLVNDDEMTLNAVDKAIENAEEYFRKNHDMEVKKTHFQLKNIKEFFEEALENNEYVNCKEIAKELESYGYETVKVPGRIIRPQLPNDSNSDNHYLANFMNAVVHEKKDGSLIYITNKSYMDEFTGITPEVEQKINFSFKKIFTDSIKDYVQKENVFFTDGGGYISKQLEHSQGGVHCLCAEVPVIE